MGGHRLTITRFKGRRGVAGKRGHGATINARASFSVIIGGSPDLDAFFVN